MVHARGAPGQCAWASYIQCLHAWKGLDAAGSLTAAVSMLVEEAGAEVLAEWGGGAWKGLATKKKCECVSVELSVRRKWDIPVSVRRTWA